MLLLCSKTVGGETLEWGQPTLYLHENLVSCNLLERAY